MLQCWVQVHDLSSDMMNGKNVKQIATNIGNCIELENDSEMQMRGFIRIKTKTNIHISLVAGFWWTNIRGEEKWVTIKYERLSDFCYECGRLRHASLGCHAEVVLSEVNPRLPMYGPWVNGTQPKRQSVSHQLGGSKQPQRQTGDPHRKSWKDIMKKGRDLRSETHDSARASKGDKVSQTREVHDWLCNINKGERTELNLLKVDLDNKQNGNPYYTTDPIPDLNLSLELSGLEKHFLDLNFEPKEPSASHGNQSTFIDTQSLQIPFTPTLMSTEIDFTPISQCTITRSTFGLTYLRTALKTPKPP